MKRYQKDPFGPMKHSWSRPAEEIARAESLPVASSPPKADPFPARKAPKPPKIVAFAMDGDEPPDEYVTAYQLADRLKVSYRHIPRLVEQDRLPQPHDFGGNVKRWLWSEVVAYGTRNRDAEWGGR